MQKRFIIGGLAALVLIGLVTGGVLILSKKTALSQISQHVQETPTPSQAPKLLIWDDPAGFTFSYPEGALVNKHDEDKDNYAHVEFTNKDHPGNLIVWAKDTTSTDVTAWVRTEKQFAGATTIDTTLGNQPAKKIVLPPNKLIVGTIYDELLFTIDATLEDKSYWTQVADAITNSFVFKPAQAAAGGAVSGDSAVDEEETIQ